MYQKLLPVRPAATREKHKLVIVITITIIPNILQVFIYLIYSISVYL